MDCGFDDAGVFADGEHDRPIGPAQLLFVSGWFWNSKLPANADRSSQADLPMSRHGNRVRGGRTQPQRMLFPFSHEMAAVRLEVFDQPGTVHAGTSFATTSICDAA
jgi:hypothetical protein